MVSKKNSVDGTKFQAGKRTPLIFRFVSEDPIT
ncbi:uncharacterized protein METZ01_LOCUS280783 [marine metagenome]|uniref:Uncharacterized protein n=1 Tax=marine metagenome TaxID=408172 RepID=A0A382KUG0_9ZZZZ